MSLEYNNCIIILNYNDSGRVIELVKTISGYQSLNKIVIVDNCSTDDSFQKLKKIESEKIDVICTDKNQGYACGNNYGAEYAMKKYAPKTLFFANPDVQFKEDIIPSIEKALWSDSSYAVASPIVKQGYNVWKMRGYADAVKMLFLLIFTAQKKRIKKKLFNGKKIEIVDVVEGSFFAIKADVFVSVKGFDERTFLYLEENILASKIRRKGMKEIVVTDCQYIHEHSKSIRKEYKSKAKAFKLFQPSFQIYLKYYVQCNHFQLKLFNALFWVAYLERVVYDIVYSFKK